MSAFPIACSWHPEPSRAGRDSERDSSPVQNIPESVVANLVSRVRSLPFSARDWFAAMEIPLQRGEVNSSHAMARRR